MEESVRKSYWGVTLATVAVFGCLLAIGLLFDLSEAGALTAG